MTDDDLRDRYAQAMAEAAGSSSFREPGTAWDHMRAAWYRNADAVIALAGQQRASTLRIRDAATDVMLNELRNESAELRASLGRMRQVIEENRAGVADYETENEPSIWSVAVTDVCLDAESALQVRRQPVGVVMPAEETEQQKADTSGEHLVQHTDITCEAVAERDQLRETVSYFLMEQPALRNCLFAGCLRQFDIRATMSGRPTEPNRSAQGWKQVRPTVASGYVCPEHADIVEQHRPRWTERQGDTVTLACACGWMSPTAIWQGYAVAAWQDHLLRPNATQCKVCKHPADQHTESDEPVSVGQCHQCLAEGDEDDAWHDYAPSKES
ncbi:hypothetical protein AB0A98_06555 [Streptomyces chrestomyceticus]|uniref:hypothetical protein n=1 Tax=Streptomyces chrestomyceticus TaxID=68185 RepID=UPI0034096F5A